MRYNTLRLFGLVSALALLAACNLTQFAYNRLDTIAHWRVGQYVTLDDAQRRIFDADFRAFWTWNRRTELPRYATALRDIAARVGSPPDADELGQWSDRYGALWSSSLDRLLPLACTLGACLCDAQTTQLLQRVDKDIADYADEDVQPSPAARRKHSRKEIEQSLDKWLGSVSPEQDQLLRTWEDARAADVTPEWLAFRQRWRAELATTLAARHAADFCPRLEALIRDGDSLWTPAQRQLFGDSRRHWTMLFVRIGASLNAEQQDHLQQRLLALADDLESLSRTAP